jgi:flagellar protein FlaC
VEDDITSEPEEDLAAANEELLAKIGELESRFPKLEMMLTNLRKENENLRESINKINENFQDIMALYEVVSNQVNPFIGISKITATSMEKMEQLEYETNKLKKRVDELQRDMVLLADIYLKQHDIDIESLIEDILAEEEVSKVMSGEDSNG